MYQTKNLGLNITEIEKDVLQPFNFETDLGANFKAIDEKTLSHRNITNCLLEVPQNIKLELVDGSLILKEGSKVYIPNGFEDDGTTPKFDEVVINSDLHSFYSSTTDTFMLYLDHDGYMNIREVNLCYSGSTAPTVSINNLWYDTATNRIGSSDSTGINHVYGQSLPIAIITTGATGYTSILQIFNGFGYISSTIFAFPGVKILIPNGRNEDGTLKSEVYTTQKVAITTASEITRESFGLFINTSNEIGLSSFQYATNTISGYTVYDYESNYWLNENWGNGGVMLLATATLTNGNISNFKIKQPFLAVDYNDFQTKITELETKIATLQAAVEALQGS